MSVTHHRQNPLECEQLYLPNANLSVFQKGSMFAAIRLFNRLPKIIQSLKEDRMSFRNKLSSYLIYICFIVFIDNIHVHLFGPVK
jgi:hypothetical protein